MWHSSARVQQTTAQQKSQPFRFGARAADELRAHGGGGIRTAPLTVSLSPPIVNGGTVKYPSCLPSISKAADPAPRPGPIFAVPNLASFHAEPALACGPLSLIADSVALEHGAERAAASCPPKGKLLNRTLSIPQYTVDCAVHVVPAARKTAAAHSVV